MAEHSLVLTDSATVRCVVCEASTSAVGLTPGDVVALEEVHCATVQEQLDVQPLFDAITSLNSGDRGPMVAAVLGLPEVASIVERVHLLSISGDCGEMLYGIDEDLDALRAVSE